MRGRRLIRCLALFSALALALSACGEQSFTERDLSRLVLQKHEAPVGTELVQNSSGPQSLDEYARNDEQKKIAMADAGFVSSYFNFFLSPKTFTSTDFSEASAEGAIADSFVMLFATVEGATQGLQILEDTIHRDGAGLEDRSADGLGDEAFAVKGTIQRGLPPGFLFAWRVGNAVFGLIAAGAPGAINENAARRLADVMYARVA